MKKQKPYNNWETHIKHFCHNPSPSQVQFNPFLSWSRLSVHGWWWWWWWACVWHCGKNWWLHDTDQNTGQTLRPSSLQPTVQIQQIAPAHTTRESTWREKQKLISSQNQLQTDWTSEFLWDRCTHIWESVCTVCWSNPTFFFTTHSANKLNFLAQ